MATRGGARNLGRDDDIGRIAPGFAADIVAWKTDGCLAFSTAGGVADHLWPHQPETEFESSAPGVSGLDAWIIAGIRLLPASMDPYIKQ